MAWRLGSRRSPRPLPQTNGVILAKAGIQLFDYLYFSGKLEARLRGHEGNSVA
jgi:hypothetical protein